MFSPAETKDLLKETRPLQWDVIGWTALCTIKKRGAQNKHSPLVPLKSSSKIS